MNGLHFDRDSEERAVELFAANVLKAGKAYLDSGDETPYIPLLESRDQCVSRGIRRLSASGQRGPGAICTDKKLCFGYR